MLSLKQKSHFKRILHFIFAFGLSHVIFTDEFDTDPWNASIKSAILAFVLVLSREFIEQDEHVIYSNHELEADIINLIEQKGYELKKKSGAKHIYSKPNFWNRKRFKIEKTDRYLKLALPEEFVDQFEQFVR